MISDYKETTLLAKVNRLGLKYSFQTCYIYITPQRNSQKIIKQKH